MERWLKYAGPLTSLWGRLTPVQKAAASMVGVLSALALIVAVSMASRPQYSVLFSNLNATDAGAIVDKLKTEKVDYHITAGGAALEVPTKDVYDLRLQLAGEGLPQGGNVGFEIFDKPSFGMTEFTQKINYQRALQGELEKTISELSPVAQARVHVVVPEQRLFAEQDKESSASVVVKLKPGGQLDQDQVAAITHLVAAAVEGLKPSNVAVVDTAGNLLSETGNDATGIASLRLGTSQLAMERQYESLVTRDLQLMLENVLGQGKAVVRVHAQMNFDTTQMENQTFQPSVGNTGILTSQDQTVERYTGAPRSLPGVPSLALATGAAGVKSAGAGDNYSRTQNESRYEVNKHTEQVTQAPGKIERMSVAVLLDEKTAPGLIDTVRQAVSSAVGIDPKRGDQVTVETLAFGADKVQSQEEISMEGDARRGFVLSLARLAAAVIVLLIFLLFIRSVAIKWRPVEVMERYAEPLPLREAEALELNGQQPQTEGFTGRSDEVAHPRRLASRRASEVAQERPEDVARLVRGWLSEARQ